ncbi:MAG: hypothetical protein QM802_07185 [Agriterribacter sp.]
MKKISLVVLVLLLCVFNPSCRSSKAVADKITVSSRQIPPEMATNDFTIIGMLHKRHSYDKYLKKGFETYPGKYVLSIDFEVNKNYPDTSKYRYYLDYENEFSSSGGNQFTYYRYFIVDRVTGNKFRRKTSSTNFANEIKMYLAAIEKVRKK